MPTENRSSNTQMVSELLPCPFCGQQDVLIERLDSDASVVICQCLTGPHEACLARGPVGVAQNEGEEQPGRDKAVELWNARAEQRQGEPVALKCWSCKAGFTLKEREDCYGCCWECGVEIELDDYVGKLAGEVERLSRKAANADLSLAAQTRQVHTLRAQLSELKGAFNESQENVVKRGKMLAERDALLAKVVNSGALSSEQYEELEAECCATSANSPKCKTCHDQGEIFVRKGDVHYSMQTEPEPVMAACPECADPSAPTEIDHDALVAAVCVLRSHGLGNLSEAVEQARAVLGRKQ